MSPAPPTRDYTGAGWSDWTGAADHGPHLAAPPGLRRDAVPAFAHLAVSIHRGFAGVSEMNARHGGLPPPNGKGTAIMNSMELCATLARRFASSGSMTAFP